jgi:hypothetical protein
LNFSNGQKAARELARAARLQKIALLNNPLAAIADDVALGAGV